MFPIVDAEVASDVCPLFFRLGQGDTLAQFCSDAKFKAASRLFYADADFYPPRLTFASSVSATNSHLTII